MAESMNLADLIVTLGADVTDYFEGMNKAIDKTKEVETTLNSIGTGLSAALTVPLAALGTAAIAASSDIKGAFNEILISTGATGEALDGLHGSFEKVFADVDDSAKEVAGVIADLAKRLDLAGAPLETLSKQVIELSEITHSSSAEMATSVSKMFQIWKTGTEQQGASLDFLFNVFQKTGASVAQLSGELTQFGPQLGKLGLDFQQSAVFLGQLEKAGVPATVALRGMRAAFEEIVKSGKDTGNAFNDIVKYIEGAKTEAIGLQRALEIFGAKGYVQIFDQIKAGNFTLDKFTESMKGATSTIVGTADAVETQSKKMAQAWHGIELAIKPIGDVLKGMMATAFETLKPLVEWVGELAKKFGDLDPTIQKCVVTLGLIAGATGPAILTITKLVELSTSTFANLAGLFTKIGGGLTLVAEAGAPAAASVTAVGGALGTLAIVAIPAIAAITGVALAWHQLQSDTSGLHSLDKSFQDFLQSATKGLTGPLQEGVGRFDQGLKNINEALEKGLINMKQYDALMMTLKGNMEAAEKEDLSAFSKSFGLKILPGDKAKPGGNPIEDAKNAAAAATALDEAWSAFGQQDLSAQAKKLEAAYKVLEQSGKATTDQLADAWNKVQDAIDAATGAVQTFTKYQDAKQFNWAALAAGGTVSNPTVGQMAEGIALQHELKRGEDEWNEAIANAAKQMNAFNDEAAQFAKFGDAGKQAFIEIHTALETDTEEAGFFAGAVKTASGFANLTATQLQGAIDAGKELNKQFANSANPFGMFNADADKFMKGIQASGVEMAKLDLSTQDVETTLKRLGVSAKTDLEAIAKHMQEVQDVYAKDQISRMEFLRSQAKDLQTMMGAEGWSGDLQKKLDNIKDQMVDVGRLTHDTMQRAFDSFGAGLSHAILDFHNFGKDLVGTLKGIGESIFTTVFEGVFKQLTKNFVTSISDTLSEAIVKPLASLLGIGVKGVAGVLGAGAGLVGTGPIAGGVAGGLDAALGMGSQAVGAGAQVAGAVTKTATGAAGSVASTLGQLGSIANIASAVTNIASGIVSGIQQAHMSADLQKIEESTRYLKIGLVTQGDSLLNDSHLIRNMLSDFFSAKVGFGTLIDLVKELTDTKDVSSEIRDFLVNPIATLLQQIASGVTSSSGEVQTADGGVLMPGGAFDAVVQAVREAARDIVDVIKTASIPAATAGNPLTQAFETFNTYDLQAYADKLQADYDLLFASGRASFDQLDTARRKLEQAIAAVEAAKNPSPETPATATTPYYNGIPYDVATTTFQTVIPANQNVVNTLLLVNQSIIQGDASIVAQLQQMGSIAGAAATGAADASTRLLSVEEASQLTEEQIKAHMEALASSGMSMQQIVEQLRAEGLNAYLDTSQVGNAATATNNQGVSKGFDYTTIPYNPAVGSDIMSQMMNAFVNSDAEEMQRIADKYSSMGRGGEVSQALSSLGAKTVSTGGQVNQGITKDIPATDVYSVPGALAMLKEMGIDTSAFTSATTYADLQKVVQANTGYPLNSILGEYLSFGKNILVPSTPSGQVARDTTEDNPLLDAETNDRMRRMGLDPNTGYTLAQAAADTSHTKYRINQSMANAILGVFPDTGPWGQTEWINLAEPDYATMIDTINKNSPFGLLSTATPDFSNATPFTSVDVTSGWEPLSYVPGGSGYTPTLVTPNSSNSTSLNMVHIHDITFRNRDDIDYLMSIVQNQL